MKLELGSLKAWVGLSLFVVFAKISSWIGEIEAENAALIFMIFTPIVAIPIFILFIGFGEKSISEKEKES